MFMSSILSCVFFVLNVNVTLVWSKTLEASDIDNAKTLWTNIGYTDYSFTYNPSYGEISGCVQEIIAIKVVNDTVISANYIGDNARFCQIVEPLGNNPNVRTINQIFDMLYIELDRSYEVSATFDTQFGYPKDAFIDQIEYAVDDEYGFQICDFSVSLDTTNGLKESDIDKANQWWKSVGYNNYEFTFEEQHSEGSIGCQIRTKVINNLVNSVEYTGYYKDFCNSFGQISVNDAPTIDQLFELLYIEVEESYQVSATFNNEYGYPTIISIDQIETGIDDEYVIKVTDFVALN